MKQMIHNDKKEREEVKGVRRWEKWGEQGVSGKVWLMSGSAPKPVCHISKKNHKPQGR